MSGCPRPPLLPRPTRGPAVLAADLCVCPRGRRRLSALSSFYRYCAAHDLIGRVPTDGVARPVVDPGYTATVGLDRDQARAPVATADADTGAQALRTAAVGGCCRLHRHGRRVVPRP